MYEQRGRGAKVSLASRLWLLTVKLLSHTTSPMLYAYQGTLPSLPVPAVNDTMTRVGETPCPIVSMCMKAC